MKKTILIIIGILILAGLIGGGVWYWKNRTSEVIPSENEEAISNQESVSQSSFVKCYSTVSTPLDRVAGLKTELTSAIVDNGTWSGVKTNKRIFPVGYFKEKVENIKEDILYIIEKPDGSNFLIGENDTMLQVCDKNNMTPKIYNLSLSPREGIKPIDIQFSFLFSYNYGLVDISEPGDYRIDAYWFVNGKWHLTDRIDKITFIK